MCVVDFFVSKFHIVIGRGRMSVACMYYIKFCCFHTTIIKRVYMHLLLYTLGIIQLLMLFSTLSAGTVQAASTAGRCQSDAIRHPHGDQHADVGGRGDVLWW